jgi:hypothetical protein
LVVIVRPRAVVIRPRIIRPQPIVATSRPVVAPPRCSLLVCADIRFKHRAAPPGELRGVLPQAGHDSIDVRYLFAAEPEHIGRAGHLLVHCSPVLLRKRRMLNGDAAADRYRKAQGNSAGSHAPVLLSEIHFPVHVPRGRAKHLAFIENKMRLGKVLTAQQNVKVALLGRKNEKNVGALALLHLADPFDRRDQARGVFGDEF